MRPIHLVPVLALALAACGEGSSFDKGFKKSYREKAIKACVEQARAQSPLRSAAVDVEGFCTCTIDKAMEGKSAAELMNPPDEKAWDEWAGQCLAKLR